MLFRLRQNPEEENPPEPTAPTSSSGAAPNRQRQDRQSTGSSALPDIFPASLSQENVVDPVVGSSQPNQSGPSLPVGDIVPARQSASNIPSEPLPQGEEPRSAAVPASSQAPEQINQDQPTTARQSASHPSDPAEADVNPQLLEQLLELEFDPCIAALAIRRTGAAGLEEAINWIIVCEPTRLPCYTAKFRTIPTKAISKATRQSKSRQTQKLLWEVRTKNCVDKLIKRFSKRINACCAGFGKWVTERRHNQGNGRNHTRSAATAQPQDGLRR